jgi:hypothetical protein
MASLSAWEKKRNRRVLKNAERLKAFFAEGRQYDDLDDTAPSTSARAMKDEVAASRKRARPSKSPRKRAKKEPTSPPRRSGRKRGAAPDYTGESIEALGDGGLRLARERWKKRAIGSVLILAGDSDDRVRILDRRDADVGSDDGGDDGGGEPSHEYSVLFLSGTREGEDDWVSAAVIDGARKFRTPKGRGTLQRELSAAELAALGTFDLDGFEAWLHAGDAKTRPSSEANARSVLARVRELVSGAGVHYASWETPFCAGRPVTMQTKLGDLYAEACEWDAEPSEGGQGRDKGNGWAIR